MDSVAIESMLNVAREYLQIESFILLIGSLVTSLTTTAFRCHLEYFPERLKYVRHQLWHQVQLK